MDLEKKKKKKKSHRLSLPLFHLQNLDFPTWNFKSSFSIIIVPEDSVTGHLCTTTYHTCEADMCLWTQGVPVERERERLAHRFERCDPKEYEMSGVVFFSLKCLLRHPVTFWWMGLLLLQVQKHISPPPPPIFFFFSSSRSCNLVAVITVESEKVFLLCRDATLHICSYIQRDLTVVGDARM